MGSLLDEWSEAEQRSRGRGLPFVTSEAWLPGCTRGRPRKIKKANSSWLATFPASCALG